MLFWSLTNLGSRTKCLYHIYFFTKNVKCTTYKYYYLKKEEKDTFLETRKKIFEVHWTLVSKPIFPSYSTSQMLFQRLHRGHIGFYSTSAKPYSTMFDFHNFGLIFVGQMHCLPQRLKSTLFEIFSNGGWKNFKQRWF